MSRDAALKKESEETSLDITSITEGMASTSASAIPKVKFIEDIEGFSNSFDPPASVELMIGAFSDLFGKMKGLEVTMNQRAILITSKIPEIEKSLKLVQFLKSKESAESTTLKTQYNLADMVHTTAEIDCEVGIVHLWLGANVMLEYTYDEAIELLKSKLSKAKKDLKETREDLALVRNQIITSEVNISRIYNWNVRSKRKEKIESEKAKAVSA